MKDRYQLGSDTNDIANIFFIVNNELKKGKKLITNTEIKIHLSHSPNPLY